MAWMETHCFSVTLHSNIVLNVIVPTPGSDCSITDVVENTKYDYENGLPVVYLLHGAYGDAFSWLRYSGIESYLQERGMIGVMVSAENSFYQNLKSGKAYETFFTEELPVLIKNVFPVTEDRNKTFIAGFSMGGYGAWYLALRHPALYGKAASLSGALDLKDAVNLPEGNTIFHYEDSFAQAVTPQGIVTENTQYDLLHLYDTVSKQGECPKLYQAVGKSDFLYAMNRSVRDRLRERTTDFVYEEGDGAHDWKFWDEYIRHALDWMMEGN